MALPRSLDHDEAAESGPHPGIARSRRRPASLRESRISQTQRGMSQDRESTSQHRPPRACPRLEPRAPHRYRAALSRHDHVSLGRLSCAVVLPRQRRSQDRSIWEASVQRRSFLKASGPGRHTVNAFATQCSSLKASVGRRAMPTRSQTPLLGKRPIPSPSRPGPLTALRGRRTAGVCSGNLVGLC